jgi:hypothetical protein
MVIALIALVASFAGTAAARVLISSSSQVSTGALNGTDVADRTIRARDLALGAGVRVRFVAASFRNPAHQQTGGHAQCPKSTYAVGGGAAAFSQGPGQQELNVSRPFDSTDRDRLPDQYQAFVDNLSDADGTFEVVAACVPAEVASSNFGPAALRAGASSAGDSKARQAAR